MNLSTEIAQLRHAYKLLNDGAVLNTKELARGLIGPLIESLEEKTQRDADKVDAQPVTLTEVERTAIDLLIKVSGAAFYVADDSEDDGGDLIKVLRKSSENLSDALDVLEGSLPDDRPGYTLGPSSRAEWALRRLLHTQPDPSMAGDGKPVCKGCA